MRKYSQHMFTEIRLLLLLATACFLPGVVAPQSSRVTTNFLESEGPNLPIGGTTLTFVFDTTGSMYDDLVQVIEGARRILASSLERRDTSPLFNFALVPFHDPEIGPITRTNDPDDFQQQLQDLYVQGGGDCPEMSVGAILEALKISLPRSNIYVFTDARAKDYGLTNDVLKLIQEKESQVVFVMTGDCGNHSHPGFKAYEQIAATSSGQVFLLNKSDVDEVLKFVEASVLARKVNLLSADIEEGRTYSYRLPIDSRIEYVTVSVSGDHPQINLRDPHNPGRIFTEEDGLEVLLSLENIYIVGIPNPSLGVWHLKVGSTGSHSIRVTANSQLDFTYGFSKNPTWNIVETMRRPIKGISNQLLIQAHELLPPGTFRRIELLNFRGEVIATYELTNFDEHRMHYIIQDVTPPEDYFHIRVVGVDYKNNLFHRITSAAISSVIPDPPSVRIAPKTPGYYGRTVTLTCEVKSLIPYTVQWVRDGTLLTDKIPYSDSANTTWELENASNRLEGIYGCIATNEEGTNRADTWLDVTEPPPFIKKPKDVTVFPKGTAILSCIANSTVPYNWTWDRPDSYATLERHNRVRQLRNGSLEIINIQASDAGEYQCIAMNEGGASYKTLMIFVQQIPHVSVRNTNITFRAGQNITLRCSATGYPPPDLTWTKDGRVLPPSPQLLVRGDGELVILDATDQMEGIYTCTASNTAGSDGIQVIVKYTALPSIAITEHRWLVGLGENAIIPCPAQGIPPPKIMWFKNDVDLSTMGFIDIKSNGDLHIMGVQDYDMGEYTCVATNTAGQARDVVELEVGSIPSIRSHPGEVRVDYGANTTMSCLATAYPEPIITWQRVGGRQLQANPRVQILPNGNLFVQGVQLEDAGSYVCIAENPYGRDEVTAQLRITGLVRPSISYTTDTISANAETTVLLPCNVLFGNPKPTIHWYKDSQLITPSNDILITPSGTLALRDVRLSDAGQYSCVATNVAGNHSISMSLTVRIPPTIGQTHTRYEVVYRNNVTLNCPALGFPVPTIEWLKDGVVLKTNDANHHIADDGSLLLLYTSEADSGTYTCRVSNPAGRQELDIELHIYVPPTLDGPSHIPVINITVNNPVTLPCEVTSIPPPTINWIKDGQGLPNYGYNYAIQPSGSLVYQRITVDDAGKYTCVATNVAGNITRSITIKVHVPPTILPGPTEITVLAGDRILLPCQSDGIPQPSITWQKDGAQYPTNLPGLRQVASGSLHIQVAKATDSGVYTCLVYNNAGTNTRTIRVNVHSPPVIRDHREEYNIVMGALVTLSCPATGFPPPTITWTKDSIPISENNPHYDIDETAGTLEIFSSEITDTGTYECTVSNAAGVTVKSMTLDILVPPSPEPNTDDFPLDLTVIIGGSINLPCEISGYPPPEITWLKNNNVFTPTVNSRMHGIGSLEINRVTIMDSGIYTCIAANIAGNTTKTYSLRVQIPPQIAPGLTDVIAYSGEVVELRCEADGIPLPQVIWHKDNVPVNVEGDSRLSQTIGGSLRVRGVLDVDSGNYVCFVSNNAGTNSRYITLTVRVSPIIEDSPDQYTVVVHNPITLHCPATGIPDPRITWRKDGELVLQTDVRYFVTPAGSLRISSAIRDDVGLYTCEAENPAGSAYKDIQLIVHDPPVIINGGDEEYNVIRDDYLSLPCYVDSYPPPIITWEKDGQPISPHTLNYIIRPHTLDIQRTRVSDSGLYMCIAQNDVGNVTHSMRVNVQVAPSIVPGPDTLKSYLGSNVTLPCEAIGVPVPEVMWQREGRKLRLDPRMVQRDSGSLVIYGVQQSDTGRYMCLVASRAGSDAKHITLQILQKPQIISNLPEQLVYTMNSEIRIDCMAIGSPRPEIKWYKDGHLIQQYQNGYTVLSNGSLLISSLQPYDNGHYACMAISESGNDTMEISIDTQVRPRIIGENNPSKPVVITITLNMPLSMTCNVTDSNPPAIISWYKDGRLISNQEDVGLQIKHRGSQLWIHDVNQADSGLYYCVALNEVGETSRYFTVSVHVPPIIQSQPYEEITVLANHRVIIRCLTSGSPPPRIMWKFEDIPLSSQDLRYNIHPDGSLEIIQVAAYDAGKYTCMAKNIAGNNTREVDLRVHVRPSINAGPTVMSRIVGTSVILPCESAGVPTPTITWEKNGHLLDIVGHNIELMEQGSLRITTVGVDNEGHYRCVATNDEGTATRTITLQINTPPTPDPTNPRNVSSHVNDDVIIPCRMQGSPKPHIRWYKNNRKISYTHRKYSLTEDNSLRIHNVESMDNGRYVCVGANSAGVKTLGVDLTVKVPPKISGNKENEYPIQEGMPIDLECRVTDAFPPPTIEWFKGLNLLTGNELGVRFSQDKMVLHIASVTPEDAGEYICVVFNAAGNTTKQWNIDIHVEPVIPDNLNVTIIATQFDLISLPCDAQGNPQPWITWKKDGEFIAPNDPNRYMTSIGTLEIAQVQHTDSGIYICHATNNIGNATKMYVLVINVPPNIQDSIQETIKVDLGMSIAINCRAAGFPVPFVQWEKNFQPIPINSFSMHQLPSGALFINSTRIGDSGEYTCVASNTAGYVKRTVILKVQEPPFIPRPADSLTTPTSGENIRLLCPAQGTPPPQIRWFKNNQLVDHERARLESDGTLVILNARPQDSGDYICLATSEAGNFSITLTIMVYSKPEIIQSSIQPVELVLTLNDPAALECEVVNAVPPANITWFKDNVLLNQEGSANLQIQRGGQVLYIPRVQVGDSGRYKCFAYNVAGNSTRFFGIDVQVPPIIDGINPDDGPPPPYNIIQIQDDVITLPCEASGSPPPMITWYKDGRRVTPNSRGVQMTPDGKKLIIRRAESIHTGTYICVATSSVGKATKTFVVLVNVPPTFANEQPRNISVVLNAIIDLECSPHMAVPAPTITWYKNGVLLQRYETNSVISSDGTRLLINNAQVEDSAVYRCVAANLVGNSTKIFNIEIHIPAVIKDSTSKQLSVTNRQSVTLECEAYGRPLPEIIWSKDGVFLSPGTSARYELSATGSLYINEVTVSDTGLYECYVTNTAGNMSREIVLEVQVPPTIGQTSDKKQTTTINRPVRLPCDAVGRPTPSVTWTKDNQVLDISDGYTVLENGMLYILNPDISHSGRYICVASNSAGTAVLRVTLEVQVPPDIPSKRVTYTVTEDQEVTLTCEATGVPPPQIRWIKNGQELPGNTAGYNVLANGNLVIPVVRNEDAGMFVCLARNAVNIVQGQRILEVQVPPSIPPAIEPDIATPVNGQVRLTCPVQGYPLPIVTWHKNGLPISLDSRHSLLDDGTLLIERVQESDSGLYVCTAINAVGRSSRELRLIIQVSPRFIAFPNDIELAYNRRLELVCEALGVPTPDIKWFINGSVIPSPPTVNGRSELVIENVRKEDAGTYKCVATNSVGSQPAHASVVINVPPRIVRPPDGGQVEIAGVKMLDCLAEGDPLPQIVWMKNGRLVQLNNRVTKADNGSLIIYGTTVEDTGEYMCKALNIIGETSVTAELRVQSAPVFVVEPENDVIDEGSTINLHCVASGEPQPTVRWHKDGFFVFPGGRRTILSNNTLRIVAAEESDSGQYSCYATNDISGIDITITVAVRVHGKWSQWETWGSCSKSCGKGTQKRTRHCNSPPPANNGRQCAGGVYETRECDVAMCPMNGKYSPWSSWEECSASCSHGTRTRIRECNNPPPQYGGSPCQGQPSQQTECNLGVCPVDGGWGEWQDWQHCSASCGEGQQIHFRRCNNPPPLANGNDCYGQSRESRNCKIRECPVNGEWSTWEAWTMCTKSCGGGRKIRTRTCTNPKPRYNGRTCQGHINEDEICHLEACPVDGGWSDWESWGPCSEFCDSGFQKRIRRCSNPYPQNGGKYCIGTSIDYQNCNNDPCSRDGGWGSWSDWTLCPATCGENILQTRERMCDNPSPAGDGQPCIGNSLIHRTCGVPPCLSGPVQATANVVGVINGDEFSQTLIANVTADSNGYARFIAQLYDVPQDIGYNLRYLISVISSLYWTSAFESGGAVNGYTLTNGDFQRETQVQFSSGEILRMTHSAVGMDQNGILRMNIMVTGEVPETPQEANIVLQPYTEDYIQTGPGQIYSTSQRMFMINGMPIPYAWNHTITYENQHMQMPYLVETLRTDGIQVNYDPLLQILTFEIGTTIEEGRSSNRCPTGFWLDSSGYNGPYCKDENECTSTSGCSHICQNVPGSYFCSCPRGFTMTRNRRTCSDIDECQNSATCRDSEDCQNTLGSYRCRSKCGAGYQRSSNGVNCADVNECSLGINQCSHQCENSQGSYRCICQQGFYLENQFFCVDVDECLQRPCRPNYQECHNSVGAYECTTVCPHGFQKNRNNSCEDINECQTRGTCLDSQICRNYAGGYRCDCPEGFTMDGSVGINRPCLDINECIKNPGICYTHGQCRNLKGSYECICPEGMVRLPDKRTCVGRPHNPYSNSGLETTTVCPIGLQRRNGRCFDVNECTLPQARQSICKGLCENTDGSYNCLCPSGYQLHTDGITCMDIDECANNAASCNVNQQCFNTKGGYSCVDVSCPMFYRKDPHSQTCIKSCSSSSCRRLADTIKYQTLALSNNLPTQIDLIRLVVVKNDNTQHRNSYFSIKDRVEAERYCNCRPLPFGIRNEASKGVLYTTQVLNQPKLYRLTVSAQGYTNTYQLEYSTEFVLYISVSAYSY